MKVDFNHDGGQYQRLWTDTDSDSELNLHLCTHVYYPAS